VIQDELQVQRIKELEAENKGLRVLLDQAKMFDEARIEENERLRQGLREAGEIQEQHVEACLDLRDRVEELEMGLRQAALVLDETNDGRSHYAHHDPTGGAGSGCPECHKASAARDRERAAAARARELAGEKP